MPRTEAPAEVRLATVSDLASIAELEQRTFGAETYPAFFFRQAIDLWGPHFLVVCLAGSVVGYALGSPSARQASGWILSAAVESGHRGLGLGRKLVGRLIDSFGRRGCETVWLTVSPDNSQALSLYQRLGFKLVDRDARYFGPDQPRLKLRRVFGTP